MLILQINVVCGVGSTGRIAIDIQDTLLEKGYESIIAYGRGTAFNSNRAIRIGNKIDNYKHVAVTRVLDRHGFGSTKATEDFITKIKKIKPDIIHLHNIHGYYINIEILFAFLKSYNKPVVWTLHDCWAFTGHCSHFEFANCFKWEVSCNNCPEKRSYPASLLIDGSYNNYLNKKEIFNGVDNLKIVTPSNWLKKIVEKSFLSNYEVLTINNGIDLEKFRSIDSDFKVKYGLQYKKVILGIANVWNERKGLSYLYELSSVLEDNVVIVLVGLNRKQLQNLPDNIVGIERTNNLEELVNIYAGSDVFVNPTLEDTFPTVNIEALACGVPVVTFPTGGSAEIINEYCGIVTKEKTTSDLKLALDKVLLKGKHNYRKSCLNTAGNYNKKKRFEEYIDLYEELTNSKIL